MEQKIDCAVIKDLLPNYVEHLTSDKTNEYIKEHLNDCPECTKEKDNMIYELHTEKIPVHKDLKKYLNKTKLVYFLKGGLLTIAIIGVLVCFIVDLAVSHKLSWSLIVDLSVSYIATCTVTAKVSDSHKVLRTMGIGSILLFPLLYGFQEIINFYYMQNKVYWFREIALPIVLICLVSIWSPILVAKLLQRKKEEVQNDRINK